MGNRTITAFKLFRQMKDGSIAPLFIGKRKRIKSGEWMEAECIPTKGFKERKGWHCMEHPEAPHLSKKGRIWHLVEIEDFEVIERPKNQGGKWFIAQRLRVIE